MRKGVTMGSNYDVDAASHLGLFGVILVSITLVMAWFLKGQDFFWNLIEVGAPSAIFSWIIYGVIGQMRSQSASPPEHRDS